jgi:hypothetical protein
MVMGGGCRDNVLIAANVEYPNAAPEINVYTEDTDTVFLWKTPAEAKIIF